GDHPRDGVENSAGCDRHHERDRPGGKRRLRGRDRSKCHTAGREEARERGFHGLMPWRCLHADVSGEVRKAKRARVSPGCAEAEHTPPAKVVVAWMAGGNGPSTWIASRWINSESCWKP